MSQSEKKINLEDLKKVTVYRKGDKVVIGEYTPEVDNKGSDSEEILTSYLQEYKAKLHQHYERLFETIKEKAYKEAFNKGYKEGYSEGYKDALNRASEKLDYIVESLESLKITLEELVGILKRTEDDLQHQLSVKYDEIEKQILMDLPDILSNITYVVANKQISIDEDFLEGYIRKAIARLKGSEVIELRVPPSIKEKVLEIADKIMETDINIRKIIVVEDEHIDSGIVADSKLGLVDARLHSVIDGIKDVIKEVMGYYAQRGSKQSE